MEFVVQPLFKEWQRFLPTKLSKCMMDNIAKNKCQWQEKIKEDNAKMSVNPDIKTPEVSKNDEEEESKENSFDNDEEADKVQDGRLPLTFNHLVEDDDTSSYSGSRRGSCRSLSPLRELSEEHWNPEIRRHSMPPAYIQRELTYVTLKRECLPITQYLRRRSLPTAMIFQTTSLEKLIGKFPMYLSEKSSDSFHGVRSCSMEELLAKPKLGNLSPNVDTSRLLSSSSIPSDCFKGPDNSLKPLSRNISGVNCVNKFKPLSTDSSGNLVENKGTLSNEPAHKKNTFHNIDMSSANVPSGSQHNTTGDIQQYAQNSSEGLLESDRKSNTRLHKFVNHDLSAPDAQETNIHLKNNLVLKNKMRDIDRNNISRAPDSHLAAKD